jgi:hypothetical protein
MIPKILKIWTAPCYDPCYAICLIMLRFLLLAAINAAVPPDLFHPQNFLPVVDRELPD